jgi:hypothetical protein
MAVAHNPRAAQAPMEEIEYNEEESARHPVAAGRACSRRTSPVPRNLVEGPCQQRMCLLICIWQGSVPNFICLPGSLLSLKRKSQWIFYLDLKSIISADNDTYNDNSVQKIKIVYNDDSYIFSNDTATTFAATFSDSSVGNTSIDSEECFQNKVEQPVFIKKNWM